jgi:hypothetical protein
MEKVVKNDENDENAHMKYFIIKIILDNDFF